MIQRIQTIYLLIVAATMAVTLFCPLALIAVDGHQITLSAFSIADADGVLSHTTAWLGAILAVATVLPLVTVFLYKNRQLQIRLCGVECVLLVGALLLVGAFTYAVCQNIFAEFDITWSNIVFKFAALMPVVGIVLTPIAMKAILRDELLVRSLDRIR